MKYQSFIAIMIMIRFLNNVAIKIDNNVNR